MAPNNLKALMFSGSARGSGDPGLQTPPRLKSACKQDRKASASVRSAPLMRVATLGCASGAERTDADAKVNVKHAH